ncbi:MAG: restriction endonuclease [Phycisphaerales bacterium]|nr:restriction endonuclease [Hyphomonadaceae bacterium]
MATEPTLWGVHMRAHHGNLPIEQGYIAIGWPKMGDLAKLRPDRQSFKAKLAEVYPEKKAGAVPVDAGTLYKFACEMRHGDLIIYPSKIDRMVNVGEVIGDYTFHSDNSDDTPHRRSVKWLKSFPRTTFTQGALHEIGSAVTLFQVTTQAAEFLAALRGEHFEGEVGNEDFDVEAATVQVEESTEDFVIRRLKTAITPERFEHFVAHLLRCMGYHARVTQFGGDGGIDIIAHKDELGFEPPVIKVQCKQIVTSIGRPEVQRLVGAVEKEEFGLFVTLGAYSREALDAERSRPNLRLVDGPTLVDLIFKFYDTFEPQWQAVIPLKRRYIPDAVRADG